MVERKEVSDGRAPYECQCVAQHEHENEGTVEVEAHAAAARDRHRPVRAAVHIGAPDEQPDVDGHEEGVEDDFAHVVPQIVLGQISRPLALGFLL